jgi:hypothetical protein
MLTLFMMIKERRRVPKGEVSQESLSTTEKAFIGILCVLNPVIAGSVFYYGWRRRLPVKAKQANTISLWAFFISLAAGTSAYILLAASA